MWLVVVLIWLGGINYLFELTKWVRSEGIMLFFNENLLNFIDKTASPVDQNRER